MTKKKQAIEANIWDNEVEVENVAPESVTESKTKTTSTSKSDAKRITSLAETEPLFDLDGLMTDFPTARELEKFVYDQTGIVLNLKGRSNKFKYQSAMDVLNGITPDDTLLGTENPYLDKNEMIPTEPMRPVPPRDAAIAAAGPEVNKFDTNLFPHPDPEWKAQDQNCNVCFRKYANGVITYEILGPIALRPVGTRINKYGKEQPEKFVWVDPRGGEQIIKRQDGSFTPLGTKIRGFMRRQRMNKSNQWDVWVDRDFIVQDAVINDNPWAVE